MYIRISYLNCEKFAKSLKENGLISSDFPPVFLLFEEKYFSSSNVFADYFGLYFVTTFVSGVTNYYSSVFQSLYTAQMGIDTSISGIAESMYAALRIWNEAIVQANKVDQNFTSTLVRLSLPNTMALTPSGTCKMTNINTLALNLNLMVISSSGKFSLMYPQLGEYNYIEPKLYVGGSPEECINGPISLKYSYSSGIVIGGYTYLSISLLVVLLYGAYLIKNKKKRIIYIYGNNGNLISILGMIMILASCTYMIVIPQTDTVCLNRLILFSISFIIYNSGQLSKSISYYFSKTPTVINKILDSIIYQCTTQLLRYWCV